MCQECLIHNRGEYYYEDENEELCVKPGSKCPNCNELKQNDCPGNQVYYRVIKTASSDNPHIPQDYVRTMQKSMDKRSAQIFVEGRTDVEMRESYVYRAFNEGNNIYEEHRELDYTKPIYWGMDFNYDPQCSVICQEIEEDGEFHVGVLDEIILWNSLPEHAAQEFVRRYERFKEFNNRVLIYGDPAGLYGTGDGLVPSFYDKIRKVLLEAGFNVVVMMKKPPKEDKDNPFRERVKIPVSERIAAVNAMLCNAEDPPKVRLKINPDCANLIRSLAELQYTEDGKHIDKMVDKRAGRSSNKEAAHLMTHPSDALGYYIYKRFPQLKGKEGVAFFQFPGQSTIDFRKGKVSFREDGDVPEWVKEKRKEKNERREERRKKREARRNSIKKYLDGWDLWGGFGF